LHPGSLITPLPIKKARAGAFLGPTAYICPFQLKNNQYFFYDLNFPSLSSNLFVSPSLSFLPFFLGKEGRKKKKGRN